MHIMERNMTNSGISRDYKGQFCEVMTRGQNAKVRMDGTRYEDIIKRHGLGVSNEINDSQIYMLPTKWF